MATEIKYKEYSILVTDSCITVVDSYTTTDRPLIRSILECVKSQAPNNVTKNRSMFSLCNEWIAHSRLYKLGIARSNTRDVDLEYPQSVLHTIAWTILGTF